MMYFKDWEIVEKPQPDGTKKRYRRRIVVVKIVKKPEELVNENEVIIEEVPLDESQPVNDDKYDPEVLNFKYLLNSRPVFLMSFRFRNLTGQLYARLFSEHVTFLAKKWAFGQLLYSVFSSK